MKTLTMSSARSVLGDDEIEEILLRLPAIDLVCYKAVCKGWRSLISSAEFVSAHLKRSKSNPSSHFILVHTDPQPQPPFKYGMVMVGSVNGLVCMVGNRLTTSHSGIFIWNPITGLSTELPPPSTPPIIRGSEIKKIAFWYDDSDGGGGVYKVAKLFREYFSPITVEVWVSSIPDTWTTVTTADLDLYCAGWVSGPHVLIEGLGAYWIVTNASSVNIFVLMLDLKTLALEAIPLSEVEACLPADQYGPSFLSGANFKGDFVLVQETISNDGSYDIWTMGMDARRSWKKSSTFHLGYTFFRCLGSVNGRLLVLQKGGDGTTLYDMETGMHDVLGKDSDPFFRSSAHGFVGSLVSIKGVEASDLHASISWPNSFASGRVSKMQMQPPPPFIHPPWGEMQMHMPPPPH